MSQSQEPRSGKIKPAVGTAENIPFKSTLTVDSDRTNLESSMSQKGAVNAAKAKEDSAVAKPDTPAPAPAEPISEVETQRGK
ncbi:hypothetical protein AAVH_00453 [Aphelenchoides avenae]|nr:hypothetical protein AAVH_00453 [Aphelenchus avenae]